VLTNAPLQTTTNHYRASISAAQKRLKYVKFRADSSCSECHSPLQTRLLRRNVGKVSASAARLTLEFFSLPTAVATLIVSHGCSRIAREGFRLANPHTTPLAIRLRGSRRNLIAHPRKLCRSCRWLLFIICHHKAMRNLNSERLRRDKTREREWQWPLVGSRRSAKAALCFGHQGRTRICLHSHSSGVRMANLRLPGATRKTSTFNCLCLGFFLRRKSSCWLLSDVRSINSSCLSSRV
jgi:hypothetical protein